MKFLFINSNCGSGSSGRITTEQYAMVKKHGHQAKIAFAHGKPHNVDPSDTFLIHHKVDYYIHNALSRITDRAGFYSHFVTRRLIAFIDDYRPDIIHLHNLHGYYVNIEVLFDYLSSLDIPVVWTLHDCWAFTGHCVHYSFEGCFKWKKECHHCPLKKTYPQSLFMDQSRRNFMEKKRLFTSIKNLYITTPSRWLASQVEESFLGDYPIIPIYNGIDLEVFKYHESDIRTRLGIPNNKTLLLGVAYVWSRSKGLSDFLKLDTQLDHSKYQILLVGLDDNQLAQLPISIIGMQRTKSVEELVEIYSTADVFINPSYEETMGMVTAEALACGTPAIVYNATAVPEVVDESSGIVVDAGDIDALCSSIPAALMLKSSLVKERPKAFERSKQYEKYYCLYTKVLGYE